MPRITAAMHASDTIFRKAAPRFFAGDPMANYKRIKEGIAKKAKGPEDKKEKDERKT